MRVISGSARGLRLESPRGSSTRPTLDRVKEAVFSMLAPRLLDARVLDLFSGSGALGIEALSRGAAHGVFVEKSPAAVSVIKTNLERARLRERATVVTLSYECYLDACKDTFDIVLLDPPYAMWERADIFDRLLCADILAPGGIIIAETEGKTPLAAAGFSLIKSKRYGRVGIYLFERA